MYINNFEKGFPKVILNQTFFLALFQNASSSQLANKANTVLHRLLTLHPPPVRATLYYQAICSPTISLDTQTKWNTTAWEYFSMVYRYLVVCIVILDFQLRFALWRGTLDL